MRVCLLSLLLFGLTATSSASLRITTSDLPNGTIDTRYSALIEASGGCTPYRWSIVSGTLPSGVKAAPSSSTTSLRLSGTPTKAKSYSFRVSVTGCGGRAADVSYEVKIESVSGHVVDLGWDASTSPDVAGYNVYRGTMPTASTKINSAVVASTLYDDSNVANGETYYYAVTTVDIYGEESEKTPAIKVVVP
jgi:hypothetical protein